MLRLWQPSLKLKEENNMVLEAKFEVMGAKFGASISLSHPALLSELGTCASGKLGYE